MTGTATAPVAAGRPVPAAASGGAGMPPHVRRLCDLLVVGGAVIAPLNLLVVRSLTLYDLAIAGALVLLWRHGRLRMPPKGYLAMAYLFLLAALLSAFRATYASEALTQVLQYAFIFFVQVPVLLTVVRTRRLALASVALLCLGTLGAILHAWLTQETQGSGRVLVFYSENPNRLGYPAVYLLPMLLVLWHAARGARPAVRVLVAALIAFSLYLTVWAVFASGSRSSVAGSVAALLVFVALRPGLGVGRMAARLVALVAVVGVLGFGMMRAGYLPDTLMERVTRSVSEEQEDRAHLVGDRENLNEAGLQAFLESPYLGTGLDNFRYVAPVYNLDATPQLPHNLWLQLLVQVGVFGTLAVAGYLLLWLRDMVRAHRRAAPADAALLWGVVASLVGILTVFLFAPEMLDRHYWLVVALGLAIAAGSMRHRTHTRRSP